ncbi:Ubiquitin [Entamoeba marina]
MFLTLLLPIVVYAQQSTLVDALETTSKAKYIIGIIGTILIIVSVFIAISFCRKGRSQRHQTGGYGPDLFAIGSDTVDMANESGSYQNY